MEEETGVPEEVLDDGGQVDLEKVLAFLRESNVQTLAAMEGKEYGPAPDVISGIQFEALMKTMLPEGSPQRLRWEIYFEQGVADYLRWLNENAPAEIARRRLLQPVQQQPPTQHIVLPGS